MCLHDLGQLSVCLAQVAVSCISFTPERHQIASWNCSEVLSITCGLTPSFMKHSAFFVLIYGVRAEVASSLLSGQRLWGCLRLSSVAPWATLPWVRVGMTQGTVFTWDSNFCFLTKKMKIHMMTMCEQRVPCTSKGAAGPLKCFVCLKDPGGNVQAADLGRVRTHVRVCVLSLEPSLPSVLSCLCLCHPLDLCCGWHLAPVMELRSPWSNIVTRREEISDLKGPVM